MTKRLLITGSRNWTDTQTMTNALQQTWTNWKQPTDAVLVHGDAKGANRMAGRIWKTMGLTVEIHPADWANHKPRNQAGLARNQLMVDLGADVCLAFPTEGSRGTWHCVKIAKAAGIPVEVFSERPKQPFPSCDVCGSRINSWAVRVCAVCQGVVPETSIYRR